MRCAIAVPPIEDFYHSPMRSASLGAVVVQEILESHGHTAVLADFPKMSKPKKIIPGGSLSYLREVIIPEEYGPLSFFTHRKRFGPEALSCAKHIAETHPDIILISNFAYAYGDQANELADACRIIMSDTPVIMGGAGPSCFPGKYLGHADAVLRGEAELTLPRLLSELPEAPTRELVNSLTSKEIYFPGPLSEACPAEHIIPACCLAYQSRQYRHFSASVSRGCPRRCAFCSAEFSHGRVFRLPPLEKAFARIYEVIRSTEGTLPPTLNIEDDNLTAAPEYLLDLLGALKQQFPDISYTAENGIDYRFLTIALAEKLISLGFRQFNLSAGIIPSASSLEARRTQDLEHLRELTLYLRSRSVPVITYAITGYPGDTRTRTVESLLFLHSLGCISGISPFYAVPGLRGFSDPALFEEHDTCLCAGSSLYPWAGSLTTGELAAAFRLSRLMNLLVKPGKESGEAELLHEVITKKQLYTLIRGQNGPRPLPKGAADADLVQEFLNQFLDISNNLKSSGISY